MHEIARETSTRGASSPPSTRLRVAWGAWGYAARRLRALTITQRDALLLAALGILSRAASAALVHQPGYIDGAYYFAVARNVAQGRGLTEDFIITYLAPAAGVVHPSNLYWMPGASLLLAPFLWLFGAHWWAAEIPNVLLSGTLPLLAYALGGELGGAFGGSRRVALGAGLLTLTAGFYYPLYGPLSDNFGLYAWAGGGALLLMTQGVRGRPRRFALAGLACGVAHLARPEAPLLLAVAAIVWWRHLRAANPGSPASMWSRRWWERWVPLFALVGLYLLVMAPWFARNLLLVGSPLPPGGLRTAWLRDYNDFYSYGLSLTPSSYLAWGIGPILGSKLHALLVNAGQLAAVMEWVLAPFALLGAWRLRRELAALPWLLYGVGAYLALSLIFTFPSINGSVLHSEIAVFPFLNVAAIVGLDAAIEWAAPRRATLAARTAERKRVYLGLAIALSAILSAFIVLVNAPVLNRAGDAYPQAARVVAREAARTGDRAPVVMVVNPSIYNVRTGQRAIVTPDQSLPVMYTTAIRYGARYLILEPLHSPAQDALWSDSEHSPWLTLLWSGPDIRVYRWNWLYAHGAPTGRDTMALCQPTLNTTTSHTMTPSRPSPPSPPRPARAASALCG